MEKVEKAATSSRRSARKEDSSLFYWESRLKSLARDQAFHLGRRIPADAHGHAHYVALM